MGSTWIEVRIEKWEKYNPRSDVKKPSWFRLDYGLVDDPDLYDLTHEEFKALIYLFSLACRKASATVRVHFEHAERSAKITRAGMESAIEKLKALSIVHVLDTPTDRPRDVSVTDAPATDVRTYETNERERARTRDEAAPQQETGEGPKTASPYSLSVLDFQEAKTEWFVTLAKFGAGRNNLLVEEEQLIARSIQRWGKQAVLMAIRGKRHEPKDDGYDPGKNLALRRILNHQEPEKFERLMNLGVQAWHKVGAQPTRPVAPSLGADDLDSTPMPASVREKLTGILGPARVQALVDGATPAKVHAAMEEEVRKAIAAELGPGDGGGFGPAPDNELPAGAGPHA